MRSLFAGLRLHQHRLVEMPHWYTSSRVSADRRLCASIADAWGLRPRACLTGTYSNATSTNCTVCPSGDSMSAIFKVSVTGSLVNSSVLGQCILRADFIFRILAPMTRVSSPNFRDELVSKFLAVFPTARAAQFHITKVVVHDSTVALVSMSLLSDPDGHRPSPFEMALRLRSMSPMELTLALTVDPNQTIEPAFVTSPAPLHASASASPSSSASSFLSLESGETCGLFACDLWWIWLVLGAVLLVIALVVVKAANTMCRTHEASGSAFQSEVQYARLPQPDQSESARVDVDQDRAPLVPPLAQAVEVRITARRTAPAPIALFCCHSRSLRVIVASLYVT
jgi:hypothetical protein